MNGDLTTGSPIKKILRFCVPLLIGTLFQQFYAVLNSIVVGQYLGMEAFAAIGSTASLNVLVIGFAIGLCAGLCIPVAQHFGARDVPALRKAEANGLYIAAVAGVLVSVLMTVFTRPILIFFNTPVNLLDEACAYIGTLFAGSAALILFNLVIGYMRALGDSRTPLFYLILASVFNVALDFLFVMGFQAGVAGAALATVVAQLIASVLAIRSIRKNFPILRLTRKDMKPGFPELRKLSAISLPIGLQTSITAIGSILLQVAINGLGHRAVAALSVGNRVLWFLFSPVEAVGVAVMVFVCQNFGAQRIDRVRQGITRLMLLTTGYTALTMGIAWFAGKDFAQLLFSVGEEEVLGAGANAFGIARLFVNDGERPILGLIEQYLRISSLSFLTLNMTYIYRNALQGLGRSSLAMGGGICETLARAAVAAFVVAPLGFVGASLGAPAAWTLAGGYFFVMYCLTVRKLKPTVIMEAAEG